MNSPVFLIGESTSLELQLSQEEFAIGFVPYSKIPVGANLGELVEYHTAILGVTGTGKTELAYDILRFAIKRGFKVFCVDLTCEYEERLKDLNPILLALEDADAEELNDKIFRAETAKFGNEEKGALLQEIEKLRPKIESQVKSFLEPQEAALAILRLDEIANTRATLRITELYLSTIFEMARKNRGARRILVVLEEAHTIVPEMNVYGRFDRSETEAVVGRTAQIALQGRKYGVGLLLVSQRTALVSKTLLSQCNTVLSFAMHDETGLRYLSNVFSTSYVTAIPNLKRFQAVAFGKGIKSERPVIFQIPDVPAKRKASEELKKTWLPEAIRAQPAAVAEERTPQAVAQVEVLDDEDGTGPY
jgi:DNA helicase HerA-like ATPase